jgi:DUF1009 family protein
MANPGAERLAVIAGQGDLPVRVAQTARQQGRDVTVFAITGQADADFGDFDVVDVALGTIGDTRARIQAAGCGDVVMVGKVKRPSLAQLRPDSHAVKLLARAVGKGDDALLRVIASFFEEVGINMVSADSLMPGQMMPKGLQAGNLDPAWQADIDCGLAVLAMLGDSDIGQGVVVQDQRVLAVEAAEGTDAMLSRCASLIDAAATPAVFVKCAKIAQDHRLDIPVIGTDTLRAAKAAGILIIACEAEGVLLSDKPTVLWQEAEQLGLAIIGV